MATLRSFLQRSAALRLYRDVLRTSRLAPPHVRKSIRDEARREREELRERVQVLERIATDPARRTAEEIDKLRDE